MSSLSTPKSLLAALTIATAVAGITGCSAAPQEARGASSSKLLAPRAVFKGAASAETEKALGISEWRIYRGKTDYVLTGYSASGKAVKGVSMAFVAHSGAARSKLVGKVLDGSRFSASHEFGGATKAKSELGQLSKSFVTHAVSDMVALRQGLKTSITRSAVRSGEACGGDLVKVTMNAVQCIAAANSSGSSLSKQLKVKECVAAAQSASDAVESCKNAGATTTPKDDAAKAPAAGGGAAKAPSKSTSADSSGKSDADQKAADEKQDADQDKKDAEQKAADQKQDAEQDAADTKADEQAGSNADAASEGQTCSSCEGTGGSDIQASPDTGEVQTADASAGAADAPADTGGDTGGGDSAES